MIEKNIYAIDRVKRNIFHSIIQKNYTHSPQTSPESPSSTIYSRVA